MKLNRERKKIDEVKEAKTTIAVSKLVVLLFVILETSALLPIGSFTVFHRRKQ